MVNIASLALSALRYQYEQYCVIIMACIASSAWPKLHRQHGQYCVTSIAGIASLE
jgi:hypothetical protein